MQFKGLKEEFINGLPWEWQVTLGIDYPFYREDARQYFYNWCSDLEMTENLEVAYIAAFYYQNRKPRINVLMLSQKKKYIKRDRTLLHVNPNKWEGYWLDHSAYGLGLWFQKEYQEGWRPKWEKWKKDNRHLARIEMVFSDEPVSHLVKNTNPRNPNYEVLVRNVGLLYKIESQLRDRGKIFELFFTKHKSECEEQVDGS